MFGWSRLNFDEFPKVYMRFKAKDCESDDLVEYRIQDLPENRFDDALNFMFHDQYLREEPFAKGHEIKDDPLAMEDFTEYYTGMINEKMSLVCFKEGSDEIVALNILFGMDVKYEMAAPVKSEAIKKLQLIIKDVMTTSAPFEPTDDEFVVEAMGLSVARKYRKRGIAVKMLESRILLMKHVGLNRTSTIFTALGSQIAAKKAGYTEYCEITYDELMAKGHKFKHLTEKSVKTLGYQIERK
uniref:CSON003498 protein n=1 Tax=Culicoides sonorensis TaxID=179676 RepID=A0A336LWE4_CULSO